MTSLKFFAVLAGVGLLDGCAPAASPTANQVTTSETGANSHIVVPAEPAAAVNAAAGSNETAPALNLAPDGLTLVLESGSARQAGFGMARDIAVTMVSAALGKPRDTGRNDECGQGPMETAAFKGGLTLFFQQDKFVGWDLDGRDKPVFTTAARIGIGSTLKQMRDVISVEVEESSLGHEFHSGDLGGLLNGTGPEAKVEHLWAGSTCQFR